MVYYPPSIVIQTITISMKKLILLLFICCWVGQSALFAQRDPFGGYNSYDAAALSPSELPSFEEYRNDPENIKVPTIPIQELQSVLGDSRDKLYLLDARSEKEYEVSRIQGARAMDYLQFSVERVWMLDRAARVVVYSATEERSRTLAQYLKLMGFLDVQILEGGLIGWKNAGQLVYNAKGKTDRIHVGRRANMRLVKSGLAVL